MKTLATALGAGAVVAAAAGGAFYANNYAIPEQLAEDMNSAFDDALNQKEFGTGLMVEKDGDITVEPAGLLTYKVNMPALSMKDGGEEAGYTVTSNMDGGEYLLTLDSKKAAALSLFDDNQKVQATLQSVEAVSSDLELVIHSIYSEDTMDSTMTCDVLTHNVTLQGDQYSLTSAAENCDTDAVFASDGRKGTEVTTDLSFTTSISNIGEDGYSADTEVNLADLKLNIINPYTGGIDATVKAENLAIGGNYNGLPAESRDKAPEDLELADLPDDLGFSIDAEGLTVDIPGMGGMPMPVVDLQAVFSASGLQSDAAIVALSYGYEIEGLENIDPFMTTGTPEQSSCAVELGNIPAQAIGQNVLDNIEDNGSFGLSGPGIAEETVDAIDETDGVTIGLDCEARTGDRYRSVLEADHTFKGEAFPGSGSLELYGFEEAVNDLAMVVGPEIYQMAEMFTQLAEPTEDGEGLVWEYELDESGNLTVNDQPMGPVLAP